MTGILSPKPMKAEVRFRVRVEPMDVFEDRVLDSAHSVQTQDCQIQDGVRLSPLLAPRFCSHRITKEPPAAVSLCHQGQSLGAGGQGSGREQHPSLCGLAAEAYNLASAQTLG